MATYNFTGALTYVTVPQGTFTITASGAQGGINANSFANGATNFGASVEGTFIFQASTNLIVLVGGQGAFPSTDGSSVSGTGGGGGSFVYIDVNNDNAITSVDTLLLAAGGGGGDGSGSPGTSGISSNSGSGSGQGGNAGAAGNGFIGNTGGGGGAGINGGGSAGDPSDPGGPTGPVQNGSGAPSITTGGSGSFSGNGGGFGGGGGGGLDGGGGGGGYTGGKGGDGEFPNQGGSGGTSYVAPTATSSSSPASTNQGDGVVSITCFATGTRIATARGEVAVEALTVGDLTVTASGEARPIRWIGHRTYRCRGRRDALPVRIAAHAFREGRPARDLFVSPAHAIAVDVLGEVLIPACRLINGTTVTQVDVEEITYWHVELDSHDILIAEGLPAESYLDCGNRHFFANADATDLMAAPDARPEGPLPFCRPFHEAGPLVDLVRARLQDRVAALGWRKVEEAFAGLHLVADGRTIRPDVQGLTARFVVPAEANDVRLVSETSVPAHVVPGSSDDRRLGVALATMSIDDGLTDTRAIALDDARFVEGLYGINGTARWTNGSAMLPATLWDGCKGTFFLRVTLAGPALPRWIAPCETAGVVTLADRWQA